MITEISDEIWDTYSEVSSSLVDEISDCFDGLIKQTEKQDLMVELQQISDSLKKNSNDDSFQNNLIPFSYPGSPKERTQ